MSLHEDEGQLTVAHLLVLAHEAHELAGVRLAAGDGCDAGRKPDRIEMRRDARRRARGAEAEILGEAESEAHADRRRLRRGAACPSSRSRPREHGRTCGPD